MIIYTTQKCISRGAITAVQVEIYNAMYYKGVSDEQFYTKGGDAFENREDAIVAAYNTRDREIKDTKDRILALVDRVSELRQVKF